VILQRADTISAALALLRLTSATIGISVNSLSSVAR
jgi:hypothetical protein